NPYQHVELATAEKPRRYAVPITRKSPGSKMSDHPSPRHPPNLAIPLLLHPGRSVTQQLGGQGDDRAHDRQARGTAHVAHSLQHQGAIATDDERRVTARSFVVHICSGCAQSSHTAAN